MQSDVIIGTHPRFESLTIRRFSTRTRGLILPVGFLFSLSHHLLHLLLLALQHRLVELRRIPSEGPRTSSEVIRGHQRSSEVLRGLQRSSEVIRGHQRSSEVIRGHQRSSEVIRGHQLRTCGALRARARARAASRSTRTLASPSAPPDEGGHQHVFRDVISMQSACNQHAISMQSACSTLESASNPPLSASCSAMRAWNPTTQLMNASSLSHLMKGAIIMCSKKQSACNQHAISMQSACNQHAKPSSLSHWMSSESRSASFSLLTKSSERHKFSLASLYEE
jgi:hypothetical protein